MKQAIHIFLLLIFLPLVINAQLPFREGTITYQGDTIKRYEKQPSGSTISRLVVYKKQDLVRIEIWRSNPFNKSDGEKCIQIRNKTGIYSFIESAGISALFDKLPDSLKNEFPDAMMFMSYADEKRRQAEWVMNGSSVEYQIDEVMQKTRWLGLPAEKVRLSDGTTNESLDAIITHVLDLPVNLSFWVLSKLPGTPLQFVIREWGWAVRLTATEIKAGTLPDSLFQIDPRCKLMSAEEMLKQTHEWMK